MPLDDTEIRNLAADLKTAGDNLKRQAVDVQSELAKFGTLSEGTKKTADDLLIKHGELSARMTELEQRMVAGGTGGQDDAPKTPGQAFVESEEVKSFMARKPTGSVRMSMKTITSLTTDADGSAGDLVIRDRRPGILGIPDRRLTIRDLLTPGRTTSNSIEYVKETGFTNAAAIIPNEGDLKPESSLKFDLVTQTVATIAHWARASKQILDDAAQLRSYIDGRLRYGLKYVEEQQILNGNGTSGNLNGIYNQATAYSAPITIAGATRIDQLRLAMLQVALAEFPATGIVLHPAAWASIELQKTTDGAYLFANPQGTTGPTLWGLPVVPTQAMAIGNFLVGAFSLGAQIFDREDASVEASTEDRDNFVRNLVTLLCEERLALAVYRPEAFIKGSLVALPT
jgi:HK97 family phage major capsid protein